MAKATFYKCNESGDIIVKLAGGSANPACCGKDMVELKANTTDAATEKHVPVVLVEGDILTATVGEVEHPMLDEHFINFVYVETESGMRVKQLNPGETPTASFNLNGEKAVAVYEYCNLHGLWVAEL